MPDKTWVVVEQPADEEYRLKYDPAQNRFTRTEVKSLTHMRGFTGAYGWLGGLGYPPHSHLDVLIITKQSPHAGDVLLAHICGIFYRGDGDHKLVALDDQLIHTVARADLDCLDATTYANLIGMYPRVDANEGWFSAEEAKKYLNRVLRYE